MNFFMVEVFLIYTNRFPNFNFILMLILKLYVLSMHGAFICNFFYFHMVTL